ncbi:MAG: hypothetical protein IT168_30750 [Bryobacterales bacterium]|nr:hypothetical protein [Bryobacterales bacterium]
MFKTCFTAFCALTVSFASKPDPYFLYEQILNRALDASHSEALRDIAFQLLRDVAEGHPERITTHAAARLHLHPQQLKLLNENFARDPGVRAHAYYAIARTGLPAAFKYLQELTPATVADLGPRDRHEVWSAAQIALQQARLMKIPAFQDQVKFLENTMAARFDSYSTAKIQFWALQTLCNVGSESSLPLLEKAFRAFYSSLAETEILFCRERMQTVQRHRDRAKALGSALSVATSGANERLTAWAIAQLAELNSTEGDAELDRFQAEIRSVPPPGRPPMLNAFGEQIDRMRACNPRRTVAANP